MTNTQARLYDVRYSRFSGAREPRRKAVLAMARSSAGRALGLRRTTGAKVWPFLLVLAAYLPAVVAVGIPLLFDADESPLGLLSFAELLRATTVMTVAFAATTLPSLLTRDRRDRVLSLYFSTALSPAEYLLGKALAAVALMSLVTLGPLLVLYWGAVLTAASPLDRIGDLGGDLPAVVLAGLVVAAFHAALGLLAGSLTGKRVFAVGGLLGALLVTPVLAALVANLADDDAAKAFGLTGLPLQAASTLLPGAPADTEPAPDALVWTVWSGVLVLSAGVLTLRYRRGDG